MNRGRGEQRDRLATNAAASSVIASKIDSPDGSKSPTCRNTVGTAAALRAVDDVPHRGQRREPAARVDRHRVARRRRGRAAASCPAPRTTARRSWRWPAWLVALVASIRRAVSSQKSARRREPALAMIVTPSSRIASNGISRARRARFKMLAEPLCRPARSSRSRRRRRAGRRSAGP